MSFLVDFSVLCGWKRCVFIACQDLELGITCIWFGREWPRCKSFIMQFGFYKLHLQAQQCICLCQSLLEHYSWRFSCLIKCKANKIIFTCYSPPWAKSAHLLSFLSRQRYLGSDMHYIIFRGRSIPPFHVPTHKARLINSIFLILKCFILFILIL